jgi:DNA-binding winged helix-turn-helix (wHTH) protein
MRSETPRQRIGDRVASAARQLVGRERELSMLERCLDADEPVVTFVHGLAGIGKSILLAALTERLVQQGARVVPFDGRAMEPTPRGLLGALGEALDASERTASAIGDHLARLTVPCVLSIDNVEALRLVEPWLRRELAFHLPVGTRVLLFGRNPPQPAWHTSPGWSGLFRDLRLGPLEPDAVHAWLQRRGMPEPELARVAALAHGHPLTLELAATSWERGRPIDGQRATELLEMLAQSCLADVTDQRLRASIDAACVVRRVTRPLLEAMLEEPIDVALLEALLELPFMERTDDGIAMADGVRLPFEARLRALDPTRYQTLRQAAWQYLRDELATRRAATVSWRAAADVLFLVRHPELREAFFPSTATSFTVEQALPSDEPAISAIAARHEPPDACAILDAWWRELPSAFNVVRDASAAVQGFLVLARSGAVTSALAAQDPLARAWLADVRERLNDQDALLARRALSLSDGEATSDVMGTLWVDAKRAYIENLGAGSVYVATRTADAKLHQLERLGFRRTELRLAQAGSTDETLRLDFGTRGVLGWVGALVDAQAREDSPWRLDEGSRALVIAGRSVALTKLEYGALSYLIGASGRVVTRDELLAEVWGQQYGGSNVVDAVVRLLRKKLGPHAGVLETVKGFGYRLVQGHEATLPLLQPSD